MDQMNNMGLSAQFLDRDINFGFSGGEIKRSELLQLMFQKPEFTMFDEPDSGVDIENMEVVGKALGELLEGRSGLVITHMGYILKYIKATKAHVLIDRSIRCSSDPQAIFKQIMECGYGRCVECLS